MNDKDQVAVAGEVLDEETIFTLAELCRSCSVQAEFIEALVAEGILEPNGRHTQHWCFPASSVRRTRITLRLQQDLGINLAGVALALDLIERIEQLEARLHAVSGKLPR
jgi:chaperone modulatory protein CbpM